MNFFMSVAEANPYVGFNQDPADADPTLGIVLVLFVALLYFVPLLVAVTRGRHNTGSIAVINIFLGWSFIGWVVALAMACGNIKPKQPLNHKEKSTMTTVIVILFALVLLPAAKPPLAQDFTPEQLAKLVRLLDHIEIIEGEIEGLPGPHLILQGVNVHVRNDTGSTGSIDQTGNLIIGWNEVTNGKFDQASDTESRFYASHNLIMGTNHLVSGTGNVVTGHNNMMMDGESSAIIGGRDNSVSGKNNAVLASSGAVMLHADGGAIVGGANATNFSESGAIVGGFGNTVTGSYSAAIGGKSNKAMGHTYETGSGDERYTAYQTVIGGERNVASGGFALSAGGFANEAKGRQSVTAGGGRNFAMDEQSLASGGRRKKVNGFGKVK